MSVADFNPNSITVPPNRIEINNFNGTPFHLFENIGVTEDDSFSNSVCTMYSPTPVSNVYFSRDNIDFIQKHIIYGVELASKKEYKIQNQNETQLEIIMRSIYLQNSKNVPCHIADQVKYLNKLVIQYCVENIMSSIQSYIKYIDDVSESRPLMDRAMSTSTNNQLQEEHFTIKVNK